MGKIFSPPKMPAAPVYDVAPPVVTTTPDDTTTDTTPELTPDEQRAQNILSRSRGRQGTIATSFRGILSQPDSPLSRKTLLGE